MTWKFREKAFRDKLQRYIKDDNSIRDEAKHLPMSHSTLHRIMTGKRDVKMDEFMHICNRMSVDPIEFFDDDEFQLRMF